MTNKLTPVVRTLGDVPPAMRKYYNRREDDWVLCLSGSPDGCVPEAEVVTAKQAARELRDANIAIAKTLKQVLGIEVEDIKALPEAIRTFSESAEAYLLVKDHVDHTLGLLQDKADSLARDLARATDEHRDTEALLRRSDLQGQLVDLGIKAGVQPAMMGAFVSHVLSTACDGHGQFGPKTAAGATIFSKRNIVAPVDVDEWIDDQVLVVPGFFKSSVVAEHSALAERRQDDGLTADRAFSSER